MSNSEEHCEDHGCNWPTCTAEYCCESKAYLEAKSKPKIKIESEKVIEKLLYKEVKRIGGICIKLLSTHFNGLPDRLCLLPGGRLFFIELKTTKKKPRKIQTYVHNLLIKLGFIVMVIDTTKQVKDFINEQERLT